MGFSTPLALALSALALPIIIFYMLKLRRRPLQVSSLLLWQRVLQDKQANAPWQRLRRNLLLLLQLLLLALLVMALARPFLNVDAKVQGNAVILLDASGSMQAEDVTPTRFEAAKQEAMAIIGALQSGDRVSLISVAENPQPLVSGDAQGDQAALQGALNALQPGNGEANWETALALAAAAANSQANTTIVIISDGALPANLPTLPAPVQWATVGRNANNQGIVALASREGRNGPALFVRAENFSAQTAEARLELYLDGNLFEARNLSLPPAPDGGQNLTFDIPAKTGTISARLTGEDDLALDNNATLTRNPFGGDVLLVGPGNVFLERAFSLLPGINVFQTTPDRIPADETFNLMVFDRTTPAELPDNADNLLFIAPPQSSTQFTVQGVFSNTRPSRVVAVNDSRLNFVDTETINIAAAQQVTPPAWGKVLWDSPGGPLLITGETDGRRMGIITFDLLKSDLPLQISFPILISNLTRWFLDLPAETPTSVEGETPPGSDNPLSAFESNIKPDQNRVQGSQNEANAAGRPGQLEFWWWLALLAVPVLLWEWYVYWRGGVA